MYIPNQKLDPIIISVLHDIKKSEKIIHIKDVNNTYFA